MNPLRIYLHSWLATRARWGESDCCLSVLDWVSRVRGEDLAAPWRHTYDDFGSAQRATRFFTDPLAICGAVLERQARLSRTVDPCRGDVACFKWPRPEGRIVPTAGICIAPGQFAMRGDPDGPPAILSARPDRLIGAWEVGYRDA